MKQMSIADAEYAGKRKQTRRERFLIEMVLAPMPNTLSCRDVTDPV